MSSVLRKERFFDIRERYDHENPNDGSTCDGVSYGEFTLAELSNAVRAVGEGQEPEPMLTGCRDCGAQVPVKDVLHEAKRAAVAMLSEADDLFRLVYAAQEIIQTQYVADCVMQSITRYSEADLTDEQVALIGKSLDMTLKYAVNNVRRNVREIGEHQMRKLG